jgi:hypothetical protein
MRSGVKYVPWNSGLEPWSRPKLSFFLKNRDCELCWGGSGEGEAEVSNDWGAARVSTAGGIGTVRMTMTGVSRARRPGVDER